MRSVENVEAEANHPAGAKWRTAADLLSRRQCIVFAWLTVSRIAVGLCDVALAAALYLLFLLLQGHSPEHSFGWAPKSIISIAVLTLILVVLRAFADVVSARSVFHQIQRLHTDLLLRLTQGYSEMQWTHFAGRNRSELANHALHSTREAADFYHRCIELIAGIVIVTAMIAASLYQSLTAACIFASGLAATYCVHRLVIRKQVRSAARSREKSLGRLQRHLADMFLSGKEIRTYRNQNFFHDRIRRFAHDFSVSHRRAAFLPQIARIVADQGAVLLFLGLIVAVELRQGNTHRLISLLVFYFVLSRRLLPLMSQISLIAGQMESSCENVRIVDAELNECRLHRAPALPVALPRPGFVLQLEQVSFSFGHGTPVLRGVNISLHGGEIAILLGPSGVGKTSLLNLIAGILQPDTGLIRVDRTAVAYVPQEMPLLDDSIRNNLLFGLPHQSDDKLMRALSAAMLSDFVVALPFGLDTHVGIDGALLSGGERQRMGLARAILRGNQLLLLDEATSALDEENERQVLWNLAASGTAVLLATHRRRVQLLAQRVFELHDGCLVEKPRYTTAIDPSAVRDGAPMAISQARESWLAYSQIAQGDSR